MQKEFILIFSAYFPYFREQSLSFPRVYLRFKYISECFFFTAIKNMNEKVVINRNIDFPNGNISFVFVFHYQ